MTKKREFASHSQKRTIVSALSVGPYTITPDEKRQLRSLERDWKIKPSGDR